MTYPENRLRKHGGSASLKSFGIGCVVIFAVWIGAGFLIDQLSACALSHGEIVQVMVRNSVKEVEGS